MTDQMTALLLPDLITTMSREAPNVDLQIVQWHETSFRDLLAGQLDVVVSPLTAPFPLLVERIMPERFVCLVSRNHPLRKKSFTLAQYLAEKHIILEVEPGQQTLVDRPLSEHGKRRKGPCVYLSTSWLLMLSKIHRLFLPFQNAWLSEEWTR
jgi:DNA-binding transcriptional LysR family regulator